jgi:hypothetical protein
MSQDELQHFKDRLTKVGDTEMLIHLNFAKSLPLNELNHAHVGMLENNIIPGLLPFRLEIIDMQVLFHYRIAGRKPLSNVMREKSISNQEWERFFLSLQHISERCHPYLLHHKYFLLDPEWIWVKDDIRDVQLAYVPWRTYGQTNFAAAQWRQLLRSLLQAGLSTSLHNRISRHHFEQDNFLEQLSLQPLEQEDNIKPTLTSIRGEESSAQLASNIQLPFIHKIIHYLSNAIESGSKTWYKPSHLTQKKQITELFVPIEDRTMMLSKFEETRLLSNANPYIDIQIDDQDIIQSVQMTDEVIKIGRNHHSNQVMITNPSISRHHLEIKMVNRLIYVRDVGSKNGSLMNDQVLRRREWIPFHDGDIIRIPGAHIKWNKKTN